MDLTRESLAQLTSRGPLRALPAGLSSCPKYSTGLELKQFQEALWEHYGLTQADRPTHLSWFLSAFSVAWYSARSLSWLELAEAFHENAVPAPSWN
jgi:hypothetical protein